MKRVTQGDVAKACGVTSMTVSLALRGHRSIPAGTRERIQREANRLGYRRDPALQALVAHRIGLEKPAYHGTVAWLTTWAGPDTWRENTTYRQYFAGLEERAEELGYRVEPFWLGDYKWSGRAFGRALQARGIDGVVLGPVPAGRRIELPLGQVSAVRVGHSLHEPGIPGVAADLRAAVGLAYRKARECGYRRIGLSDSRVDLVRLHGHRTAQFLYECAQVPEAERTLPVALEFGDKQALLEYVRRERLDAVIAVWPDTLDWIRAAGLRVPGELGYVQLGDYGRSGVSRVVEAAEAVGLHAMNLLDQRLRHNDRGPIDPPMRISLEPHWVDGETL
jgi:LacI family transcriptional regulator